MCESYQIQPMPLLGREAELVKMMQRLAPNSGCRLLTLTGPGGFGKTRLGLQAAVRLLGAEYFDGVLSVLIGRTLWVNTLFASLKRGQ